MQDLEQAIRERAYHLWDANGRHEGDAESHWLAAQREILASSWNSSENVSAPGRTQKAVKKTPAKKRMRAA